MYHLNKSKTLNKKINFRMLKQNFAPKIILDKLPACLPLSPTLEVTMETNKQKHFYEHNKFSYLKGRKKKG